MIDDTTLAEFPRGMISDGFIMSEYDDSQAEAEQNANVPASDLYYDNI